VRIRDLCYRSDDDFTIRGWLIEPEGGEPRRGFVVGHRYGGIERPDFEPPCAGWTS
jgi:cephalosporin-C deacetylase